VHEPIAGSRCSHGWLAVSYRGGTGYRGESTRTVIYGGQQYPVSPEAIREAIKRVQSFGPRTAIQNCVKSPPQTTASFC
jgi:hypothetical protein